jgi:cyanophycinase-like exopeptidase
MTVTTVQTGLAPLYLFADSQLLFWKRDGKLLLESVRESLTEDAPAAAYIGASNGDRPEFYEIFRAAMDAAGFPEHRMISSAFTAEDGEFLARAQLILLAGGDVHLGWSTFEKTGMKDQILARYAAGAVLVGISAGAVQLGRHGLIDKGESAGLELFDVFSLIPALIDVHDEQRDWGRLTSTVRMLEGSIAGLGIPTGGGLLFHSDGSAEALRHPVHEFRYDGVRVVHSLLMPEP